MDPFRILELTPDASSREIIQAAALALRKRQYSGHEIALAQKKLLDPVKKQAHAFLHSLELGEGEKGLPGNLGSETAQPEALQKQQATLALERLTLFDADSGNSPASGRAVP